VFYFFFQAEDGIRDFHETGVQTCALPIYFSTTRLSLLDRGFIYAIAHIRGGEELGRDWYENGKLLKKKNTFTDFIDCSRFLIDRSEERRVGKEYSVRWSAASTSRNQADQE